MIVRSTSWKFLSSTDVSTSLFSRDVYVDDIHTFYQECHRKRTLGYCSIEEFTLFTYLDGCLLDTLETTDISDVSRSVYIDDVRGWLSMVEKKWKYRELL